MVDKVKVKIKAEGEVIKGEKQKVQKSSKN
jgi:hypothetical protein